MDEVISMMFDAETLEKAGAAERVAAVRRMQYPGDEEAIVQAEEALETKRRALGEPGGAA
jgi:hypothetical protein